MMPRYASAQNPECGGWLGALLGQCCTPADEHVEDLEFRERHRRFGSGKSFRSRQAEAPGRYLIDNSILQIHGKTGIRYRHSKCMKDKVRAEDPARWGEVVRGVPDGDDWLHVGRYYLPMTYQGIP